MVFIFVFITTSIPVFAATPSISKDAPIKGSITISKKGATFTVYKLLDAIKSGDAYEYSVNSDLKDFFNNSNYGSYSQESIQKLNGEQVKEFAINSFTKFLGDLDEDNFRKLSFPSKTSHYKLFNWEILNFNYTSMLDNILALDKGQFDPHPWTYADRQIQFYVSPHGYASWRDDTNFSTYLMTNITHPHGYQNVPKSMLFGFDNENQITNSSNRDKAKNFLKPYWAQNDKRYKSYFNDTDLFILYGLSIGNSDFWWWNNILNSLLETDAELIIYNYNSNDESDTDTINRFIDVATNGALDDDELDKLYKKIAIVQYDSETKLNAFKLDRL